MVTFPRRFTAHRFLGARARFAFVLTFGLSVVSLSGGAFAQWGTTVRSDEMTGETSAYATSDWVSPRRQMRFPYGDVRAVMGVGCKGSSEWVYIRFTTSPNIANADTQDGYNSIWTRVRWDDETGYMRFRQKWGGDSIQFQRSSRAIEKIKASNSMLLELDWYGSGNVYFEFPLDGASKAIEEGRESCRQPK